MKRIIYTDENIEQIKTLYKQLVPITEIAKQMNTDKGAVRREIINLGLLRSKSEARRIAMGIKFVRSDAFDILTPEALYWIGFLYADGSIEKNVPTVGVSLAEIDKGHLEKFNQFLGGQLNVTETTSKNPDRGLKGQVTFGGKMFRLKVADQKLYNKLKDLGFTSNKTYTITPHELLKSSRDFWRGVVDGDGWVGVSHTTGSNYKPDAKIYYYPKIGLSGNNNTIDEFLNFIKISEIVCASGTKKAPRENELYSMDSVGKPAIQIMNLLYKDAVVYLDRKYQKYQELKLL